MKCDHVIAEKREADRKRVEVERWREDLFFLSVVQRYFCSRSITVLCAYTVPLLWQAAAVTMVLLSVESFAHLYAGS